MDYGFVNQTPEDLKKGDNYMTQRFEVARTGDKQQFYTLYRELFVCTVGYFARHTYQFIQNLSLDKDDAMKKATEIANRYNSPHTYIDLVTSPRPLFDRLDAFGLNWRAGRKAYYAEVDSDFWALWKKDKDEIKSKGFWINKSDRDGKFYIFRKIENLQWEN